MQRPPPGIQELATHMAHLSMSGSTDTTGTTQLMKTLGVQPGETKMADKRGNFRTRGPLIRTNVYPLVPQEDNFVYRYDVTITGVRHRQDGSERRIELTKKAKGDYVHVDRRNQCRDVFSALKYHQEFLKGARCMYYDLQSLLYSLDELMPAEEKSILFKVQDSQMPEGSARFAYCEVIISKAGIGDEGENRHVMDISDLDVVSSDAADARGRELLQFFDIATSQWPMFMPKIHTTFSAQSSYLNEDRYRAYGFADRDVPIFQNRTRLLPGAQKSTRFITSDYAPQGTGVVIEAKKTPFHLPCKVLDKARSLVNNLQRLTDFDVRNLRDGLKGIYVATTHGFSKQMFFIHTVVRETASQIRFFDEKAQLQTTVAQYFERNYARLNEPETPLVVAKGSIDGKLRYYPMEVLEVLPHQRVKGAQQTPQMVQETIRSCAVPPMRLIDHIEKTANSLSLFENDYLREAGIFVKDQPLCVPSGHLAPGFVAYADKKSMVVGENGTWQTGRNKFLKAADPITKWAAITFTQARAEDWQQFIARFVRNCRDVGMHMPEPSRVEYSTHADMPNVFKKLDEDGYEFLLALHHDQEKTVHEDLKLHERNHLIITQAIRSQTMMNVVIKNQWQTMGNIVAKTNVKLGGVDYEIMEHTAADQQSFLNQGYLIIGIALNHPFGGPGSAAAAAGAADSSSAIDGMGMGLKRREGVGVPSVLGFAANTDGHSDFAYIGDFLFQHPEREMRSSKLRDVVVRSLENYRRIKHADPKRIIIYRGGHDEGHFAKILSFDVPLMKDALQKVNCKVPMTMIVVNKLQGVRFFLPKDKINPQGRPAEQNIQPGMVVDTGVVHPKFQEFFLSSHRALQGTARVPKYTVLLDENQFPIEALESISYQLCYGHQIVNMPTSLPSPLYIANRYAERGRKLYSAIVREGGGEHSQHYEELNELLCYHGVNWLQDWRINA